MGRSTSRYPPLQTVLKLRPYNEDFSLKGAAKIEAVQVDYAYGQDADETTFRNSAVLRPADIDSGVSSTAAST